MVSGAGPFDWIVDLYNALFDSGQSDAQQLASRFEPTAGQTTDGWMTYQSNGFIWMDLGGDGQMDALMWEDPLDGDSQIDYRWNESIDQWEPAPTP